MNTPPSTEAVGNPELKAMLVSQDVKFWSSLDRRTRTSQSFPDLLFLSTLRRKAQAKMPQTRLPLRLAILGGYSLYPLRELIEQSLFAAGFSSELWVGDYDNYVAEIMEEGGALQDFKPQVVLLLPAERRCRYGGRFTDPREKIQAEATTTAEQLLGLCQRVHERTRAEVILANHILPAGIDPGPFRARTLASDWNFIKLVNLELGLRAPAFVHLCDLEFLATRRGLLASRDEKAWFESKQPCAPDLMVDIAHEVAYLVESLRRSAKKVLVLDLDNTLWGGVIGDDGVEGIELGDTSPRGEAFKAFQKAILSLTDRGVLLAVASKNDHDKAMEPFEKHPDMVLKPEHIVSFKANWNPKPDNIRQIAADLQLGLDSLVFVDDNPAEIEIVRQFLPEVSTLLLGPDPSEYVGQLLDGRWFEPRSITEEDAARTQQYRQEAERRTLQNSTTDMDSYLSSLGMTGTIQEFLAVDVPRISQLINKSNQFNLTTRRRTEAEVLALMQDPAFSCFTVRLADRFGDHGLISVVICKTQDDTFAMDTWLMSCRVLKRQVEEEVVNEINRLARRKDCRRVLGSYVPTAKNGMVKDLLPRMGFKLVSDSPTLSEYEMDCDSRQPVRTHIRIQRRAYESA